MVTLQFALIFLLLAGTSRIQYPLAFFCLSAIATFLAAWSFTAMRTSKLRIMPEPHAGATLVRSGPYRFLRHPMYTSVLTGCFSMLMADYSLLRLCCFAGLVVVLIAKLFYEEKLLAKKFSNYSSYASRTWRLVPGIF